VVRATTLDVHDEPEPAGVVLVRRIVEALFWGKSVRAHLTFRFEENCEFMSNPPERVNSGPLTNRHN
jgi:hypothetical protein